MERTLSRFELMAAATLGVLLSTPAAILGQLDGSDQPEWVACDSADGWVVEASSRFANNSRLAGFAADEFGPSSVCDGRVEDHFDDVAYGSVRLTYADSVTLTLTTMPLSTSIESLRSIDGFEREAAVIDAVRRHAEGTGVNIDWDVAEREDAAVGFVERYRDPEPGLNASVSLRYVGGRLVEVTFSMAL